MKNKCYLLYDYLSDIPVGVFDDVQELSLFLGRTKEVIKCAICRINKGINKFVTDTSGNKYIPYVIDLKKDYSGGYDSD